MTSTSTTTATDTRAGNAATVRRRLGEFALVRAGAPILLVLLGLFVSGNAYLVQIATEGLIAYILAASFNVIYGYAGGFNMAHVITYGLGAFTSVYLETHTSLGFWASLAIAVVGTAALSVLVAIPSRRLGEIFLAIQTLAFGLAVSEILVNWQDFSGGTTGLYFIPSPTFFGTTLFGGEASYFWLVAVFAWLVFELMTRIHRSAMRRKFTALRESPRILAAVGLSASGTRLVAFAIAGGLAGLAGALFAHFQLVIDLDTFSFGRLIALLLAVILGGAGYFWGPLFGVVALLVMDELSLATSAAHDLIYGLGILVLVIGTRGGIAGGVQALLSLIKGGRARRSGHPAAAATAADDAGPAVASADDPTRTSADEPVDLEAAAEHAGSAVELVRRRTTSHTLGFDAVTVRFGGNTAVDGASATVSTGEVVGLIGPNGAGKTTLLNTATGDTPMASGQVRFDDVVLGALRQYEVVNLGIGRTFQSPKVIPDLSVVENVMLGGDGRATAGTVRQTLFLPRARGDDRRSREKAMELLSDLSIGHLADRPAGAQTYGVLRMIEIARNLMLDPAFLLFDEPGAGLTELEREEVAQIVRGLSGRGLGVLLVDHNLPLITAACDRIYVLEAGRVIAAGPPAEVFAQENVISAYLGAAR
ncbi:ATP-binding cassette domain-containing protein [Nakamurella sp. YIM 132087]|uniref:ATP-binding cassette domain-containing protein n=1 Tax=Nakamurella alba TaxID=2665158 RepID=A0A7K1FGJ7_9ACTN|nr:ATP-binding cassette domain-containing protein [Nakamurella alba]MTD12413.1 ATP-binding cassette domain-containing protein [Nakamurella alba]